MATGQHGCIFCGNKPLTKEHIWGQWITEYVSRTTNKYAFGHVVAHKKPEDNIERSSLRAGDPIGANVRVVCGPCNNEWMSQLQEKAKPHLIPLFKGETVWLKKSDQAAIADWIIMATMTAEYIQRDPSMIAISQTDRNKFFERKPLANWKVWIAPFQRKHWIGQWVHTSVPIYPSEDVPPLTSDGRPRPNAQNTTFVIGQLYAHAMSGPYPNIVHDWEWRGTERARHLLRQVFPTVYRDIAWPTSYLTDADAIAFATAFNDYVSGLG